MEYQTKIGLSERYFNLGYYYLQRKKYVEARKNFLSSFKLKKDSKIVFYLLLSFLFPFQNIAKKLVAEKYRPQIRGIILSYLYRGNAVSCPCCYGSFRNFLPFGVDKIRLNAMCPKCSSLERHRLLWLYLQNKTNLLKDKLKVLHFAPEYIFQKKFKTLPNLQYISADLNSPSAMVRCDITSIPYSDESFDVVLCIDVLEHIPQDRVALSEIFRVLKKKGWAILQVPVDHSRDKTFEDPTVISEEERQRVFGHYEHVRIYGLDYKNRLEEAGFKVKVENYISTLNPEIIFKYAIDSNRLIYYCMKD